MTEDSKDSNNKYFCLRCKDINWLIQCVCGLCNEVITRCRKNKRNIIIRKFKLGHHSWKNGRKSNGYWYIKRPNHPNADNNNYVADHRLVYEHYLKILFDEDIYIPTEIHIHHINKQKLQNGIINLQCMTNSEHIRYEMMGTTRKKGKKHKKKDTSDRFCSDPKCKNPTKIYYDKNGYEIWLEDGKGGHLCKNCNLRRWRQLKNRI